MFKTDKNSENISIHSPHARGDMTGMQDGVTEKEISIHSPHARGDRIVLRWSA